MNSWTWPEAETTLCIFRRLYNQKDRKSFCRICTRRAILIGLNWRHLCILYPVLFINQCVCIAVCLFFYLIKHSTGFDTPVKHSWTSVLQLYPNLCARLLVFSPLMKTPATCWVDHTGCSLTFSHSFLAFSCPPVQMASPQKPDLGWMRTNVILAVEMVSAGQW